MTYTEAEGLIQDLSIREAIAIQEARFFEEQAYAYKQQAVKLREYAASLVEKRSQIWDEVDNENDT